MNVLMKGGAAPRAVAPRGAKFLARKKNELIPWPLADK
jgi:hypothetical protein